MLAYFDYVSGSRFPFFFITFFTLTNLSTISYAELSKKSASISVLSGRDNSRMQNMYSFLEPEISSSLTKTVGTLL